MWDLPSNPRYDLQYMLPAQCAQRLLAGEADLGLIPIAALTPELAIVPGCTIASVHKVRSIQLISRVPLNRVKSVAADTASRSSVAYAELLFRHFLHTAPAFHPAAADTVAMLADHDAALLIGDPALLALERRDEIEAQTGPLEWHDVAELWTGYTRLPWVAAVWAVRPAAVGNAAELIDDLTQSRVHGQGHIAELVALWTPRLALPPATIEHYLTRNIHYVLDAACLEAITLFRALAAQHGILAPLPGLNLLRA
jgi:chorismate dehydratase